MRSDRLLFLLILLGCLMRIIWTTDMEWKTDEKLLYAAAEEAAARRVLPASGIQSAGGIVNPGMSVGLFAVIAAFTDGPVAMARAVQWLNVLALLGFLFLGRARFTGEERTVWTLGMALAAVSPLAVLFSRKIWAQDLLPLFSLLIVLGHLHRHRVHGAFLWGLAGALMGQVHMSGFFLAFGLVVLTVLHDRANGLRWRWIPWLAGSALGGIALIPWLNVIWMSPQHTTTSIWHVFQLNFFFYWLIDPLALNVTYTLREEIWGFLREPLVAGSPTYLVGAAHMVCVVAALLTLRALVALARRTVVRFRSQGTWRGYFHGMTATDLYFWSILLGLGICMPLTGVMVFQHYLICAFPFTYIFLARMLRQRRKLFTALLLAEMVITSCFLWYIHRNGGAPEGDYGVSYAAQTEAQRLP